ncbi:Norbelladine synthase [Linum perenne]
MIRGEICHEAPVEAPATVVWESYRGLELSRLVNELMPHLVGTVEVVDGDGSAGTVVKLTYPPGTPGPGYLKEVFKIMDDETRVKESYTIEGGLLDLGFDHYTIRVEVIEEQQQSIIKSTIKYEVKDDSKADLVSQVTIQPLITIAKVVGDYIVKNHKK